ncbi:ABC transporter substrate-binding protein [Caldalkalibacillus salinus]|uniref:ABC transporter substrate-binding protein n=1 Tax=Caldalkalibacillus salinus TaxID=2803787 RepID=UPI001920E86F|nr:ABC transporter substrate-binding protein [Caldalkalibacillus salinus]
MNLSSRPVIRVTLFLLLSTIVLVSCSSGADKDGSETVSIPNNSGEDMLGEQVLSFANDQEPAGLDPHKVPAHSSIRIYEKLYNSLLDFDENMTLQPDLAVDWEQPDDVTYIFHLREGVQFHNGREMTANDVAYSFERILDPETASIAKSYFDRISDIEVISPYAIKIVLEEPYGPFLSYVASVNAAIVPQEVVEEHGDLMQVAVGTGPFKLVEWVPDTHVMLEKNDKYFMEGQPRLDGIYYVTMKDESSRLAAIRTGEVHVTPLSSPSIPLVENHDDLVVNGYQSNQYSYVGFNFDVEPFSNHKVRQAISLAIDRQALIDMVWRGDAVITGPIPPSLGHWSYDVSQEQLYQQDIEEAKRYLDEAGYGAGFDTTISTASTYPDMIETAQVLQQQLEVIGINAQIEQLEWGQYIDAWSNRDHEMLVGRNGAGTDPDRALGFFFETNGSANVWGFSDENYDQLIDEGKRTSDEVARIDIYTEAQKALIDLTPNLFLVSPEMYLVSRQEVQGFQPTSHHPENFLNTFIEE